MIRKRQKKNAINTQEPAPTFRRNNRMSDPKPSKPKRMGRPPVARVQPDADFLDDAMKRKGVSQQELASQIGMQPSLFTRSKQGQRPWTLTEVTALARKLTIPIETLLRRFGYELPEHGAPIVGRVLPDSTVSPVVGSYTGKRVELPANIDAKAVAYVNEQDGAVYVVVPNEARGVPPGAFGRVCIVEADNNPLPWLGTLDKARQRDAVSLRLIYGDASPKLFRQLHDAAIVVAILYL
jgi:hypothetical protein